MLSFIGSSGSDKSTLLMCINVLETIAVRQLGHVGLGNKLRTFPGKLSSGQHQRMAIARDRRISECYEVNLCEHPSSSMS